MPTWCLCYPLLRPRGPQWMALLALTLMVTSPFLYCFSRLAILEPMLTTLLLAALNSGGAAAAHATARGCIGGRRRAVHADDADEDDGDILCCRRLGWAMLVRRSFQDRRREAARIDARSSLQAWFHPCAVRCAAMSFAAFAVTFGAWMALVVALGYFGDYKYLLFINKYVKPTEFYWPLLSFWWSMRGLIWIDHILIPLCEVLIGGATLAAALISRKKTGRGAALLLDPVFGASILAAGGYILFMTYQNHPQPRYFALVAVFCFLIVAMAAAELVAQAGPTRLLGWGAIAVVGDCHRGMNGCRR